MILSNEHLISPSFILFRVVGYFRMKRENLEMEEMSMRHVEIKKEPQDFKDVSQVKDPGLDNGSFKEETSYLENPNNKSELFSNETVNDNVDFEDNKPLKKKKQKRNQ